MCSPNEHPRCYRPNTPQLQSSVLVGKWFSSDSASGVSPGKRRKLGDCRHPWHPEWKVNFLVAYNEKSNTCMCLKCSLKIGTVKKYTLQRHCESVHPETMDWSNTKKKLFVEQAKERNKQMQVFNTYINSWQTYHT